MLPIIIGAGAAIALVAAKGRPSTLFRLVEDGVVGSAKGIARGAKRFKRSVKIEYSARQLAAMRAAVERADAQYAAMSVAERREFDKDVAAIQCRAEDLRK